MSTGSLIIVVAMLVLGVAWLAYPFIARGSSERQIERQKAREIANLTAAYERALMSVRDLDEDYQVGKLPAEVYAVERARWIEKGAAILEAIDKAGGAKPKKRHGSKKVAQSTPITNVQTAANVEEDPVEQAIAAYMAARSAGHDSARSEG